MKRIMSSDNGDSYITFFKSIPIFSHLDDKYLEILLEKATELQYEKGEIICKKDSYARVVYIIKSGCVTELAMDNNGFSIMVKERRTYDCFGELGVLLGDCYATTVVASSAVTIISIPEEVFSEVFWENQSVIKELLSLCLRRLQRSAQKSLSLTMFNSEGRLAYMLLMMENEKKDLKYIKVTQEILSTRCGIARQTASTILNSWKKSNIIDIKRGKIKVIDVEALTDIVISSAKSF